MTCSRVSAVTPSGNRFGGLLALHRHRLGLSQFALSVELGCSGNYVSRLEGGKAAVTGATIAPLVEALGLSRADACALYVAAGLLPPGEWVALGDDFRSRATPKEGDDAV